MDRLALDAGRVATIAQQVRDIVALPDPVGEVIEGRRLANGLEVRKVRVPLGVIAVVYEARPNVTIDAAALCLKSGNAIVLRGSSMAAHSPTLCIVALGRPKSTTGQSCMRNRPSEVPPLVDNSGVRPVSSSIAATTTS